MKQVSNKILNTILQIVERFPQGASIENILQVVVPPLPRRSLQRYLAFLAMEGRLNALGKGRSRLYHLPATKTEKTTVAISIPSVGNVLPAGRQVEKLIPLSSVALSIQANVHQPIQARRPVGYNREFLDKYRPNETYYLSESIRNHLFEIGKSTVSERPAGTYARQILNRLLIDLSWNSSRLEGNTYSLLETERLLELGEAPEGKDSMEAQMILMELLRDVFVWAYERSSALYSATRQELGEPDPFRLRYRNLIITMMGEIIRQCLDKQAAVAAIKQKASETMPVDDRARFIEVIETELMSLHKGNIARFRLRPSEYDAWLKTWH